MLVLKKAFGLRSDSQARNENRRVPTLAEEPGTLYDGAVKMWAALPAWRKPIMSAALCELLVTEEPSGLQVILGMIKASTLYCSAGKVDVWSRLILRVKTPREVGGDGGGAQCDCARCRLWDEALVFADDFKEKSFCTVFVEPTKMYYTATNDLDILDNVEVHGSSAYLGILMSTLGVQCPRIPFLTDMPIGIVSFLDALDKEQLSSLWKPENFGKPFPTVPECRNPRVDRYVTNHLSNFIFNGRSSWLIANSAVDADTAEERRLKLKPYLDQFSKYFSVGFLVPRLTQQLLQEDSARMALQEVLEELRDVRRIECLRPADTGECAGRGGGSGGGSGGDTAPQCTSAFAAAESGDAGAANGVGAGVRLDADGSDPPAVADCAVAGNAVESDAAVAADGGGGAATADVANDVGGGGACDDGDEGIASNAAPAFFMDGGEASGEEDEDDVRFWVWNLEELPAQLRVHRATRLLRYAGLLKEDVSIPRDAATMGDTWEMPMMPTPSVADEQGFSLSALFGMA
eukprot:NODE_1848_length_2357_cov_4.817937.p1 GENE.NODE_1848_length_2357_cov_4.817937~~NODE_1848_length_2357_cov_4.817937.p1  ORF type:complete len:519 (+),score=187.21 NODE_1848_length_2357_cov_4.817937:594-2150(+)